MNLKEHYQKNVIPAMQEKFGYKNRMTVPRPEKVILNIGISASTKDPKAIESAKETLRMISGAQPAARVARKSISNFKIRRGQTVGLIVTLRGRRMYDFLERLIKLTLPRTRDFRGLDSRLVDRSGNLSLGLREAVAFPEAKAGEIERQHGLEITVVTNANNREEGLELLRLMGFPFRHESTNEATKQRKGS